MECNWNSSSLPWLARDEQDFCFGAKDASYLTSATGSKYDISDLPDWMESRDILVQPNDVLSINPGHFDQMEIDCSSQGFSGYLDAGEDYGLAINPDEMLVPLSELQTEKYASQCTNSQTIVPAASSPQKVIIRVGKNVVPKGSFQQLEVQHHPDKNALQSFSSTSFQSTGAAQQDLQNYNTDKLLDELVSHTANGVPNQLTTLIESLDSSVVQAVMDEFLSQLENNDSHQEIQGPQSPVCMPSPVPSVGSLSPQSASDYSFRQLLSPEYYNDIAPHSENVLVESVKATTSPSPLLKTEYSSSMFSPDGEHSVSVASPVAEDNLSVLSPNYKDDELYCSSPSALRDDDDDETMSDYRPEEEHSYLRSPRKNRSKRSSSSAYPESRKERKKEQNKQAALRYRQKKKQEDDELMTQIRAEEERQRKLKKRYSNLKQELSCLKKLMREVLIARGSISPDAFKKK